MWLKENTEALLLEKAKVSDAMSPPDYYGALYAFYVSQNELRKAGSVMYLLGRRLAGEEALTRASLDKMVFFFLIFFFLNFILSLTSFQPLPG